MGDTPLMKAPEEYVEHAMDGILYRVSDYANHENAVGYSFLFFATEMVN
jgi:phosphate transport system substrate-binding protein